MILNMVLVHSDLVYEYSKISIIWFLYGSVQIMQNLTTVLYTYIYKAVKSCPNVSKIFSNELVNMHKTLLCRL